MEGDYKEITRLACLRTVVRNFHMRTVTYDLYVFICSHLTLYIYTYRYIYIHTYIYMYK